MRVNLRAVLFDVDDTLFDRERAQEEILHLIVQELPDIFAGIDSKVIADAFRESDRLALQEFDSGIYGDLLRIRRSETFLRLLGLNEDSAGKITTMYVEAYPAVNAPVKDSKLVVETLAKRYRLGIVSNGFPDVQYRKLETLGIRHLFDCVVLSEESGVRKPDPEIFWKAANLLANDPQECLHVGDSYNADILGAKGAGMQACWFNPYGLHLPRVDPKPDLEISALNEILGIL
jgi:putative hydrolase of the HAD superfamily